MCFFDQHLFACGDWRWGHFRQHCNQEYRTGETCGMKLIMSTHRIGNKCKTCEKIDTKMRRRATEAEKIARWQRDGGRFKASIDKAYEIIRGLEMEIHDLQMERQKRSRSFGA
jgi:hypothetical protein